MGGAAGGGGLGGGGQRASVVWDLAPGASPAIAIGHPVWPRRPAADRDGPFAPGTPGVAESVRGDEMPVKDSRPFFCDRPLFCDLPDPFSATLPTFTMALR